ncbi:MAG TPA: isochorismatase family protein [Candidatus Limnocylindrales bacterium]|nr:isochorismatase family protein [Candidatus Limnocylindrales bacterium]
MITSDPKPGRRALVVIDVQRGFDDATWWGTRNNPDCEKNVKTLVDGFAAEGSPIVLVRHDSGDPESPLHPDRAGNAFKPALDGVEPALVVPKHVHSAFHGEVDLHAWLRREEIGEILVCGIQTNRCCETTARLGGDLGYDVGFVIDATHTFDEPAQNGRDALGADLLAQATATNLHGHFANVTTTAEVLGAIPAAG